MWFVVTAPDVIVCECSGFTVGALPSLSVGSLGICVFTEFSFLRGQRISKRPSPVGIWHAKWDGEGLLGWRITGHWGGDCGWSGAVLQPGADAKSVVVSPWPGCSVVTAPRRRVFSTLCVCQHWFVSIGMEVSSEEIFFSFILHFPDSSQ